MSIRLICPKCGAEQLAAKVVVGRRVRCPNCDKVVTATPAPDKPEESEREEGSVETAPAKAEPLALDEKSAADPALASATESASGGKPARRKERPAAPPASTRTDDASKRLASPHEEPVLFRHDDEEDDVEMDMTPMVDVTFLLLIFFMVTAAFSLQKSIEVPNPNPDEATTQAAPLDTEENPDYVTVLVDSYNTYRVLTVDWNEEAPSEQELLVKLRLARAGDSRGRQPTRLLVQASGEAFHEKVVAALDAGAAVGMQEVQLMTIDDGI